MKSPHIIGFTIAALLACAGPSSGTESTGAPEPPKNNSDTVPLYTNLGSHHKRISTKVAVTQQYFDQGLRLRLRIQSRGSDPLVHARGGARSHLRHVLLGDRTRLRPEHQRSNGLGERSGRIRGGAESAGAQVPRHGG